MEFTFAVFDFLLLHSDDDFFSCDLSIIIFCFILNFSSNNICKCCRHFFQVSLFISFTTSILRFKMVFWFNEFIFEKIWVYMILVKFFHLPLSFAFFKHRSLKTSSILSCMNSKFLLNQNSFVCTCLTSLI